MNIGSFSVDCPQINGTYNPDYTTMLATNTSTRTSLPSYTTSTSSSSVPVSPTSYSQTGTAMGTSTHTPSSSTNFSTPLTPTSSLREIRSSPSSNSQSPSSSSPSPSPSSSRASNGSGNDGGLSGPSTIAMGVVLPGVAVIVAIIFGVLGVKKWKNRSHDFLPRRRWSF